MHRLITVTILLSGLTAVAPVRAQTSASDKPVWKGISAKASKQIADVTAAMSVYSSQDKATQAGYIPVFGWIPTMGTHWVSNIRMLKEGKNINLDSPVQLMYSPVDGKQILVGAAYSYLTALNDTTKPASFDGNPMWHEHPDLAPDGMRLVMLHVWFVPSPDGPFAGHNPYLPYWAANITPPDAERMKDPAEDTRARKVAAALSVVVDTAGLFPQLHKRAAVRAAENARGDTIRSLMPELDAAAKAKDWARWDRAADRAVAQWDALATTYLGAVLVPENKVKVQRFIDDMTMKMNMHDMAGMHH